MKRILSISAILLLCCLSALSVRGQVSVGSTEVLGSLRMDRNPVLLSMAGAGSTVTEVNQAFAAFGNPAAAALAPTRVEAGVSYASWMPQYLSGKSLAAGVTAHPVESFALSLGASRLSYPSIELDGASFDPSDLQLGVGAGLAVSRELSLGVAVNYVKQALLEDYSLSGLSVSAMAQYCLGAGNVAVGLAHLGGKVGSEDGSDFPLPTSVKLAGDYSFAFGEDFSLQCAVDGDYYFSGNYSVAAGLNLGLAGIGFLRGGYRFASKQAVLPSCLGLGAGVRFAGVTLDLAYLTASETLSGTWMVGIGYRF